MFILYGMSSAKAVLVHTVTSLNIVNFPANLSYIPAAMEVVLFVFFLITRYVVDLKRVRWPSSDTLVDIFVIFLQ